MTVTDTATFFKMWAITGIKDIGSNQQKTDQFQSLKCAIRMVSRHLFNQKIFWVEIQDSTPFYSLKSSTTDMVSFCPNNLSSKFQLSQRLTNPEKSESSKTGSIHKVSKKYTSIIWWMTSKTDAFSLKWSIICAKESSNGISTLTNFIAEFILFKTVIM